jgi:hypothetical protein
MIAGGSAVALLIIMFLPWFGIDFGGAADEVAEDLGFAVPGVDASASLNAWEAFEFIDLVLLVTIVVAVGTAVATATAATVALPVAASAITTGLGLLSTLLIAYRLLDPPGGTDRKFGVFLGLIAAAGIAWGGWMLMQEEGAGFDDEASGVGGGADPPPSPPPAQGGPPSSGPPPQGPAA